MSQNEESKPVEETAEGTAPVAETPASEAPAEGETKSE